MTGQPLQKGESETTKETILRISTEFFARGGVDRVTMRDIAAASNVTLPTIYHHFKDKKNLYREVEKACYGRLKGRLLDALSGAGKKETRLKAFIGELFDVLYEDAVFRNLALRNLLDPGKEHHQFLVGTAFQSIYDELVRLLNEVQPGTGSGTKPLAIIGAVLGFIALEPAKRQLDGYAFKSKSSRQERDEFISDLVASIFDR